MSRLASASAAAAAHIAAVVQRRALRGGGFLPRSASTGALRCGSRDLAGSSGLRSFHTTTQHWHGRQKSRQQSAIDNQKRKKENRNKRREWRKDLKGQSKEHEPRQPGTVGADATSAKTDDTATGWALSAVSKRKQFAAIQPHQTTLRYIHEFGISKSLTKILELRRARADANPGAWDKVVESRAPFAFKVRDPVVKARAGNVGQLPEADLPEVAFIGRTNVGKSSLLNAIVGQTTTWRQATGWSPYAKGDTCPLEVKKTLLKHKGSLEYPRSNLGGLAKVSDVPGTTLTAQFFEGEARLKAGGTQPFRVVDLPGYGFSYADESQTMEIQTMLKNYLQTRNSLKAVFLLIDGRQGTTGIKMVDQNFINEIGKFASKVYLVMTKCDEVILPELARRHRLMVESARKFSQLEDETFMVSSATGACMDILRRAILQACDIKDVETLGTKKAASKTDGRKKKPATENWNVGENEKETKTERRRHQVDERRRDAHAGSRTGQRVADSSSDGWSAGFARSRFASGRDQAVGERQHRGGRTLSSSDRRERAGSVSRPPFQQSGERRSADFVPRHQQGNNARPAGASRFQDQRVRRDGRAGSSSDTRQMAGSISRLPFRQSDEYRSRPRPREADRRSAMTSMRRMEQGQSSSQYAGDKRRNGPNGMGGRKQTNDRATERQRWGSDTVIRKASFGARRALHTTTACPSENTETGETYDVLPGTPAWSVRSLLPSPPSPSSKSDFSGAATSAAEDDVTMISPADLEQLLRLSNLRVSSDEELEALSRNVESLRHFVNHVREADVEQDGGVTPLVRLSEEWGCPLQQDKPLAAEDANEESGRALLARAKLTDGEYYTVERPAGKKVDA